MLEEIDFSDKCPHCGNTDEKYITEINGCFTTGARYGHRNELHIYHCRKCGIVFGSD